MISRLLRAKTVFDRLRYNYREYKISPFDKKHYYFRVFVANEEVRGQGAFAQQTFDALELDKNTIQRLYIVFCDIDEDGSGMISAYEFCDFLRVDFSKYIQRVFAILDGDEDGKLDFREFVVCIWNYCTFDPETLCEFAFALYDDDDNGILDFNEIHFLVAEVFGGTQENASRLQTIMSVLDTDGDGVVSKEEFQAAIPSLPALLFPAFQVQQLMRHSVLGLGFWKLEQQKRLASAKERTHDIFEVLEKMGRARSADVMGHVKKLNADQDAAILFRKQRQVNLKRAHRTAVLDMLPGTVPGSMEDIASSIECADAVAPPLETKWRGGANAPKQARATARARAKGGEKEKGGGNGQGRERERPAEFYQSFVESSRLHSPTVGQPLVIPTGPSSSTTTSSSTTSSSSRHLTVHNAWG
jgi:Ca2+-binding EF-hand superfamily protein